MTDYATRMERFTAMAETAHLEQVQRQKEEEEARRAAEAEARELAHLGYSVAVNDAAMWAAERVFGAQAVQLLDFHVFTRHETPEGFVEAAVTVPTLPHSMLLIFHAPYDGRELDSDAKGELSDAGSFYFGSEVGSKDAGTRWPVGSLAELGALLAAHQAGELNDAFSWVGEDR